MTKKDKTLANRLNFLLEAKALTDSVGKFSAMELGFVHSVGKSFITICHKEKIFGYFSTTKKDGSKYIKDTFPNIELAKKLHEMDLKEYHDRYMVKKKTKVIDGKPISKVLKLRLNFLIEAQSLTDSNGCFSAYVVRKHYNISPNFVSIAIKNKIIEVIGSGSTKSCKYVYESLPTINMVTELYRLEREYANNRKKYQTNESIFVENVNNNNDNKSIQQEPSLIDKIKFIESNAHLINEIYDLMSKSIVIKTKN